MPHSTRRPVFFDPSSRRWRQVLRVAVVVSVIVAVLLGSVLVAVSVNPGLPPLGLESGKEHVRRISAPRVTVAAREARFDVARKALDQHLKRSLPPLPVAPSGPFERIAFYVNWDD